MTVKTPESGSFAMQIVIGNGEGWTFLPVDWKDTEDGILRPSAVPREHAEAGMQGYRFAFHCAETVGDFKARFQARHDRGHSDVGLIFRAVGTCDFYVFHLPCCGQAYRAQHFWAAVSRMDHSGYLRIQKLAMVPRVDSLNEVWHDIEVDVAGDTLRAVIDGRGKFEVSGLDARSGAVGLMVFNEASIRDLDVDAKPLSAASWTDSDPQPVNWLHPYTGEEYGLWQKPQSLLRTATDEIALIFGVQERPYSGETTCLATRSHDNGRTWNAPEPLRESSDDPWGTKGRFHRFPDGEIRCLAATDDGAFLLYDVSDDLREMSEPRVLDLGPVPEDMPALHVGPQAFLNQSDGSLQLFLYGGHDSSLAAADIRTWGAHHCRAFTSRSTDNGRTWSPLINIDGTVDPKGQPTAGNLDLTEVCCEESAPGTLVALIRPIYSPWMWETWSRDGGLSWSPCLRGPFPGFATPAMLKTASGVILVAHRLPGCTIHASFDGGHSWDRGTMIDSSIWVMGSMLEIEPDLVLYVYYDSFESKMRAQFIRVAGGVLRPER